MTYEKALAALADPTRRAVFESVAGTACAVGEIAERLPVSRPAVSQHLRVLREAGLVRVEARGTRRIYAVDGAGLAAVRAYLDRFWDQALTAYREAAEHEEG